MRATPAASPPDNGLLSMCGAYTMQAEANVLLMKANAVRDALPPSLRLVPAKSGPTPVQNVRAPLDAFACI
jgi:hypothetical protein|eukprot:COSAG01_NODE_3907_length_5556_cov_8.827378_9_plen_71_part_00